MMKRHEEACTAVDQVALGEGGGGHKISKISSNANYLNKFIFPIFFLSTTIMQPLTLLF